jgi:4-carboxymuconolactone decarboxylase
MESERYTEGMKVRRAVLGDAYVDRALASVDELSADMQQYVTEAAWGSVWTRPGLPRRERSIITLSMLVALNRPHELRVHVLGGLNNGLAQKEIVELIMHSAAYCGFPAALDALRVAREVFAEHKK